MEEISIDYGEIILERLNKLNELIKELKDAKKLPNSSKH